MELSRGILHWDGGFHSKIFFKGQILSIKVFSIKNIKFSNLIEQH